MARKRRISKDGPKSLTDRWILDARYQMEKLKGIREKPVPDCSSSFQEWNKIVEDVEKCQS